MSSNYLKISGVFCILTGALQLFSCSSQTSPENVVRQYALAVNSHSVDSVMQYYTDDIVFIITSRLDVSGTDAMRGISEHDSTLGTILTLADYRTKGDSVYCSVTEKNDYLSAAGLAAAYYPNAVFAVKNGRISFIEATMADSTSEELKNALSGFEPWVEENYPDTLAQMSPQGKFIHNGKNAATLLALLKEWQASTASESPSNQPTSSPE